MLPHCHSHRALLSLTVDPNCWLQDSLNVPTKVQATEDVNGSYYMMLKMAAVTLFDLTTLRDGGKHKDDMVALTVEGKTQLAEISSEKRERHRRASWD